VLVFAYLRASTVQQDATRAKDTLQQFANEHGHRIAGWFIENVSGAKEKRPELLRLIEHAQPGDVMLIEQVDRLTRMNSEAWGRLKSVITAHGLYIVSLDLPTSWQALSRANSSQGFHSQLLGAINELMLDILAITARKDYEDRKRRQAEGISKNKAKFTGRKADDSRHKAVIELRMLGKSISETMSITGYSHAQVCRIWSNHQASSFTK
jgi:DNA invertase Pin-like site-specific DNA recombinase